MQQTDKFQFDQLLLIVADLWVRHLQAEIDQFDQLSTKSTQKELPPSMFDHDRENAHKNLL